MKRKQLSVIKIKENRLRFCQQVGVVRKQVRYRIRTKCPISRSRIPAVIFVRKTEKRSFTTPRVRIILKVINLDCSKTACNVFH